MLGPTIDVVILSRTEQDLVPAVAAGIKSQKGVNLRVHRHIGTARADDVHRIETIARARNEAVGRTNGQWLLFLDDDVQLAPNCVWHLYHALSLRPSHAAVAADYLGEMGKGTGHVAMGATLFRKAALTEIPFRWEENKCECLCWCEDARRKGMQISYLPTARALHLPGQTSGALHSTGNESAQAVSGSDAIAPTATSTDQDTIRNAKILVAFNRRDVKRFSNVFLKTLRTFGNHQEVVVVGYGLYPSECRRLSLNAGVRVIARAPNGQMPPVRRISDFGEITATYDPRTPVAYWDASDVLFQGRLDSLWKTTQTCPDKLLAVREPKGYPHNAAIKGWTHSIQDPRMRRRAFQMFATNPFLNSGFAAGTAATMTKYFREATRIRHSPELLGTTDWGDQTALNMYCHTDKSRWREVSQTWNYCVHDRQHGDIRVTPDGVVTCKSHPSITVVHGNAKSLPKMALIAQS